MYGDGRRRREEDWNADVLKKELWVWTGAARSSWDYIGEVPPVEVNNNRKYKVRALGCFWMTVR